MRTTLKRVQTRVLLAVCICTVASMLFFLCFYQSGALPEAEGHGKEVLLETDGKSKSNGTTRLGASNHSGVINAPSPNPSLFTSRKPYLFFMEIDEQLSSNTLKFLQLCYFSALWNFSMIEPQIDSNTTYLSSLPTVDKNQPLLFFDLYNKTAVEKSLTKCFKPNLPQNYLKEFHFHTMDEAMIYSPRQVLIVRFMTKKWTLVKFITGNVCDGISKNVSKSVLEALNSHVHEVEKKAKEIHGQNITFHIWRTICISALPRIPFSIKNATIYIQKHLAEKQREANVDLSVVIQSWRKVKKLYSTAYYYDPTFVFDSHPCQERCLPHSQRVLSVTDKMIHTLKLTGQFIGIYARTERLGRADIKTPGYIDDCFQQLIAIVNSSELLFEIPRASVVLVHDAGKYGSSTFYKSVRKRSDMLLTKFQLSKIHTVSYDPEPNKGLPQHRAFVAAVEQEFLSRSHVLVTMGGGGFMMNAKGRFVARQGADRLHTLCVS